MKVRSGPILVAVLLCAMAVAAKAADEFKDYHLLALHPHGPGVFHSAKRPITTLADLRGMRVRAPTRLTNRLLASFGATPVGMPLTQVAESLSKGVIDGWVAEMNGKGADGKALLATARALVDKNSK